MWQLSNDKICPKFLAVAKFQKTYILNAFLDFESDWESCGSVLYPFEWILRWNTRCWLVNGLNRSESSCKWVLPILLGVILLGSMSFWLLFCNEKIMLVTLQALLTSTLCLKKKSLLYKSRNLNSFPNSIKIFVNSVRFLVRIIVKIQAATAP